MTEATKLICDLIAKGVTNRETILKIMATHLSLTRKEAIYLMDIHRDIMKIKAEILFDPSQRKLK